MARLCGQAGLHMIGVVVRHRTHDRHAVHQGCSPWQQVGKMNPGNARRDRAELATYGGRTVWLRVKRFLLGVAPMQKKHDHLLRPSVGPGCAAGHRLTSSQETG